MYWTEGRKPCLCTIASYPEQRLQHEHQHSPTNTTCTVITAARQPACCPSPPSQCFDKYSNPTEQDWGRTALGVVLQLQEEQEDMGDSSCCPYDVSGSHAWRR